ncbi:hypothetical protein LZ31DRAFT_558255 [Colletotrichum somersetense]|nr:hypothetical protein LZ31DRAFT_558255 [Colletotrichum somersetense]
MDVTMEERWCGCGVIWDFVCAFPLRSEADCGSRVRDGLQGQLRLDAAYAPPVFALHAQVFSRQTRRRPSERKRNMREPWGAYAVAFLHSPSGAVPFQHGREEGRASLGSIANRFRGSIPGVSAHTARGRRGRESGGGHTRAKCSKWSLRQTHHTLGGHALWSG